MAAANNDTTGDWVVVTESVYVTHQSPLGRHAPYYIARVDLAYSGLPGQVEQLWLNDEGDNTYSVACVPFCANGISYADRVLLDSRGEYVKSVVEKSSNRVLRVLLAPTLDDIRARDIRAEIEAIAESLGVSVERHGDRFDAFNVAPENDLEDLLQRLQRESERGTLYWEWGDSRTFGDVVSK